MCKVYNTIGSLTAIKSHLHKNNINDFKSLNEVIAFKNNYSSYRQQIISTHESLIQEEKQRLNTDIQKLEEDIKEEKINIEKELLNEIETLEQELKEHSSAAQTKVIQKLIIFFKRKRLRKEIAYKKSSVTSNIEYFIHHSVKTLTGKSNRYQYIISNFTGAVNESCAVPLKKLEKTKRVIDEINNSIYGALGEQKVVKELENLSDEYYLINDFSRSFKPAIYNRQENDYIRSIQIDHILVSPAGIFLIETKNWSEESLNNHNLRSPVEQIKRTNFALFKMLSEAISDKSKLRFTHHWGERKIPVRNLIVLTNKKPKEEFQYVKILTVQEIIPYINYFKPVFSNNETKEIAYYLLNLIKIHP